MYNFREAFTDFWVNSNLMSMDSATQVFKILKQQNRNYLTKVSLTTMSYTVKDFKMDLFQES
jgi:hypothetical protein